MNGHSQGWHAGDSSSRGNNDAVRQQYSDGVPLPPGAPDFPPVSPTSARPAALAAATSTRPGSHSGPGRSDGMGASPRHRNSYSLTSPMEAAAAAAGIQRAPSPRRYSQGQADPPWPQQQQPQDPTQTSSRQYQPHTSQHWYPGHHASYSQPALPSTSPAPHYPPPPLAHPHTTTEPIAYARPVSPRPMLPTSPDPLSHAQAGFSPASVPHIPRVHSPQPRRNTMPAPIIASPSRPWQQPQVQSYHQSHSPHQYSPSTSSYPASPLPSEQPRPPAGRPTTYSTPSTIPRVPQPSQGSASTSRRSLPKPPGPSAGPSQPSPSLPPVPAPPVPSTSSIPGRFATVGATPSPALSRSSSVASTASVASTGSIRRPLPRPPLPAFPGGALGASSSSSPSPGTASPLQQQHPPAGPRSRPPAAYDTAVSPPTITLPSDPPDTTAAHANGLSRQMQDMRVASSPQTESAINGQAAPAASSRQVAPPSIQLPDVPSLTFDGPGNDNDAIAPPVISIAVAPPSPSLSKATSSDFFEPPQMPPDEGIPLPSCSVPMATSSASSGKSYALACPGCDRPVLYGRTVNAMGKRWHPDCFQCAHCAIKLEHFEFFTKDGKPYCHVDYHELFSIRCSHCKTPIVDESYITIDDPAMGGKKTYHELHFFCANCGDPFIDPKSRSAAAAATDVDGDGSYAKPFTVHNGHAYCEACNLKLHKPRCNSCKKPIEGDVLRALNKNWCDQCFVCDSCRKPFEDGTFLVHQGGPHCEDCYRIKLRAEV